MNKLEFPLNSALILKRTQHILEKNNICTLDELCKWSYKDLVRLNNFGRRCLENLIVVLKFFNMSLKEMPNEDFWKNPNAKGALDVENVKAKRTD